MAQPDVVLRRGDGRLHQAIAASRVELTFDGTGGPVAWNSDGLMATLAIGTPGAIDLRDAASGAIVRTVDAHPGRVTDLALSADGRWLATGGDDGRLRLWDPATGRPGAVIQGSGPVSDLAFDAHGTRVVAVWPDEMVVRLVETSTGRELWRHEGPLVDEPTSGGGVAGASPAADDEPAVPGIVGISPDGRYVGVGPGDVWVYDSETGRSAFHRLRVPFGAGAVAWSPDGRLIATAGLGGVDLWDASTGAHLDSAFGHASGLDVLAWSPDSRQLAVGTEDADEVIVFDQADGRLKETETLVAEPTSRGVASLAFSSDGRSLVAGAKDRSAVKVWDVTLPGTAEVAILPSAGGFGDVGFTQGGQGLVSVDEDGFARVHDLVSGGSLGAFWGASQRACLRRQPGRALAGLRLRHLGPGHRRAALLIHRAAVLGWCELERRQSAACRRERGRRARARDPRSRRSAVGDPSGARRVRDGGLAVHARGRSPRDHGDARP